MKLSLATAALLVSNAAGSRLPYAGYEPDTAINQHAGIAGDQAAIEKYLARFDEGSFAIAQQIYEEGGSSKSYAWLTLSAPLSQTITKGTKLTAQTEDGTEVIGKALDTYTSGSNIGFQYPTTDSYLQYSSCNEGALPVEDRITSGCLAESGNVAVDGLTNPLAYTERDNLNARTIQGFSTKANSKFRPGESSQADYYEFFKKYITYYGTYDFADLIAMAGFDGSSTSFTNGNFNLAGYTFEGRAQIAKKATAYIVIYLYVLRELEDAIYDCNDTCPTCNEDSVHANDEAVAFYVGSLFASDPNKQGNLPYALAEKRALNFATATEDGGTSGQSSVNEQIMLQFNGAKSSLAAVLCDDARKNVDEIIRLGQIPFIQGTLRYAYKTEVTASPTESQQAEAAIFAAGILPAVHECNPDAAKTIHDNVALTSNAMTKADFSAVKSAFESVYDCLGVTCAEVGGLMDESTGNTYIVGAEPCGGHTAVGVSAANGGSSAGIYSLSMIVGAVAGVAALFM